MTMNFRLSDEQAAFQDMARGFARDVLLPAAALGLAGIFDLAALNFYDAGR
jgi:hypothetical protein